ncbi:rhomboid family intramembrane serine protease [Octadecabacter sp. R77987]|uniref:rhomboid family intramembrane serine protease n=1 Tax=Octadecabacter sp. R77987 TaxID=3093874 RepID=UPI00367356BB
MQNENPFNAIPPIVLALVAVIIGVEAMLSMAQQGWIGGRTGIGWRPAAVQDYGMSPRIVAIVFDQGLWTADLLKRFVTYPFIHGSFTHALWGIVLLLALGKYVGEVFHPVAVIILFLACTIGGALVYGLMSPRNVALIGVFPPVYGLIGAYTYLMWLTLGRLGENQLRAFTLIIVLLGIMLVYGMLFGSSPTWIAEIAGFVIGLVIAPVLSPGGWGAFVARVRQRP